MRRDLCIGILASVLFDGGLALLNDHPAFAPPARRAAQAIEAFVLPPMPPDEPPSRAIAIPRPRLEFSPPSLPDVARPPAPESIPQPVQPPDPDASPRNPALLRIPPGADVGPREITLFEPSNLDQGPVATVQGAPVYPFPLKQAGIGGTVLVDFVVDAGGSVRRPYAVSSTNQDFEAAAVQGVSKWKFRPGRKGGRPVNTHMQVPIVFSLNPTD